MDRKGVLFVFFGVLFLAFPSLSSAQVSGSFYASDGLIVQKVTGAGVTQLGSAVGTHAPYITFGGNYVFWVSDYFGEIYRTDLTKSLPNQQLIINYNPSNNVYGIAVNGSYLYVFNSYNSSSLWRYNFDGTGGKLLAPGVEGGDTMVRYKNYFYWVGSGVYRINFGVQLPAPELLIPYSELNVYYFDIQNGQMLLVLHNGTAYTADENGANRKLIVPSGVSANAVAWTSSGFAVTNSTGLYYVSTSSYSPYKPQLIRQASDSYSNLHFIAASTLPATPTSLYLSQATNTSLAATFSPMSGVTGYELQIRAAGTTPWTVKTLSPSVNTAYTFSGLISKKVYEIRVRGKNLSGNGPFFTRSFSTLY